MSHSPEPWSASKWGGIIDADGCRVATFRGDDPSDAYPISDEDEARIIACVNACQGIPTEVLENGELHKLVWRLLSNTHTDGTPHKGLTPNPPVYDTTIQQFALAMKQHGATWEELC